MTITLYGFAGSTYVRSVRMLLAAKNAEYDLVPVNVLTGETHNEEHLKRHPFGKVPVLDHDGLRVLETSAINRYLNDTLPGETYIPGTPKDRARMDTTTSLIDSYGYGPMIGGVAAFHLFPDFVGGKNEEMRSKGVETSKKIIEYVMGLKGADDFIAGAPSLADFHLAPICTYLELTPDAAEVFAVDGFSGWWSKVKALDGYKSTMPALG